MWEANRNNFSGWILLQRCWFSNVHREHILSSLLKYFLKKHYSDLLQESLLSGVRSRSYSCSSPKISLGRTRVVRDFTACNSSEGKHCVPLVSESILSQGRVSVSESTQNTQQQLAWVFHFIFTTNFSKLGKIFFS